jgi:2-polyprenyl-3-methyl-5-hydroxy-6-metoxy-1,4-benzoquinol methylase
VRASAGGARADKLVEQSRYDARAREQLAGAGDDGETESWGSGTIAQVYRAPYVFYEKSLRGLIRSGQEVLELGAGMGLHTEVLLDCGARVTATDISPNALALIERNLGGRGSGRLRTCVADLEALPFDEGSFDVVVCAGSLSYGDPVAVDAGVQSVLKSGGALVCVDSLNHNPVYRLNRWVHYLLGRRTRSTLERMPRIARLRSIAECFDSVEIRYFGTLSWALIALAPIVGGARAAFLSDLADRLLRVRTSAFKFVLVARCRR